MSCKHQCFFFFLANCTNLNQFVLWFLCSNITGCKPAGSCHPVTEGMAAVHTPTGSLSDFSSNKEAKGAVASWMVSALTSVGCSIQDGHLILHRDGLRGMFSQSGIAITKRSSVLIDWNEVIYPLVTKCVIYANDSLCWLICFNSYIHCSCLNVYCNTVFSISDEDRINFLILT